MLTIGVSIGLPEPHATLVQDVRRALADPQADAVRTHLTLLPPTRLSTADLAEVQAHLAAVASRHSRFRIVLAGTDTFRPVSPVVFIAVSQGEPDCAALAAAVRSGPLERRLDFPYHPHVTVAHHVPPEALDAGMAQLADFRLTFWVEEFQLYLQGEDSAWVPLRSFPLAGSQRA